MELIPYSFIDPTLEHALDSDKPWALYAFSLLHSFPN
jgi:hypothetical protein